MHRFTTRRRIEFADTDMGGIVHFTRFFVFMETAEHEFLRALGTSVVEEREGRSVGWPRVAASCEYRRPARFGEELEIELRVLRKGTTSMTYAFRFSRAGEEIAVGRVTSVCCAMGLGPPRPVPLPAAVAAGTEEAPA